ncbi:MAG: hypothetical protein IKA87_09125 [Lentisphaeria bacterium]|nr:hypothetical protein [Lentisphaeria bacterium]
MYNGKFAGISIKKQNFFILEYKTDVKHITLGIHYPVFTGSTIPMWTACGEKIISYSPSPYSA